MSDIPPVTPGDRVRSAMSAVALLLAFALLGCGESPRIEIGSPDPAPRVEFSRSAICSTCLAWLSASGTDLEREAGTATRAPVYETWRVRPSTIAEYRFIGGAHVHRWRVSYEATFMADDLVMEACGKNWPTGNLLAGNLMRGPSGAGGCVLRALRTGELTRQDVDVALRCFDGAEDVTDAMRAVHDRVVAVAQACPEWRDWL